MGILEELGAWLDQKRRNMASSVANPGLLYTRMNEDARKYRQDWRDASAAAQSVMPDVRAAGLLAETGKANELGVLLGWTAWNGSPHKFDKFDLSKIGTGEGAQAYGHGLYFADNPRVAQEYANTLSQSKNEFNQMYKVDISDAKAPQDAFLQWDKPLGQQTDAIKQAVAPEALGLSVVKHPSAPFYTLSRNGTIGPFEGPMMKDADAVMREWWNQDAGTFIHNFGQERAAEMLRGKGIPGIRYLDGGSRGLQANVMQTSSGNWFISGSSKPYPTRHAAEKAAQEAGNITMNTVLFDDSLVKILERNGVPVEQPGLLAREPTKFQLAHAEAQRNAALPVEQGGLGLGPQNTAMDRAKAMGFDADAYHGGTNDFQAFQGARPIYAAEDPAIASIYANATGRHKALREINAAPNVIPLKLGGRELTVSDLGEGGHGWFGDNLAAALGVPWHRGLIKDLKNHGYDRLKVTNMSDLGGEQVQYMIPPGSQHVRSRFAAFDPKKRDSSDLLASMGLLGLLGSGAYGSDYQ